MLDEPITSGLAGALIPIIATAREGAPAMAHCFGMHVADDGHVRLPLVGGRSGWALEGLRRNAAVSVLLTPLMPPLRSRQLKGYALAVEPANADDVAVAEQAFNGFRTIWAEFAPWRDTSTIVWRPDIVLRMQVERVYDQTPGPL